MKTDKILDQAIESLTQIRVKLAQMCNSDLEEKASEINLLLCEAHDSLSQTQRVGKTAEEILKWYKKYCRTKKIKPIITDEFIVEVVQEYALTEPSLQKPTTAQSEVKLLEKAKQYKLDLTKPHLFAVGWRDCFEWLTGFKGIKPIRVTDEQIEAKFPTNKENINADFWEKEHMAYENNYKQIGAKMMRDNPERFTEQF